MRIREDRLSFNPILPDNWEGYSFSINFRGATVKMEVNKREVILDNYSDQELSISLSGKELLLLPGKSSKSELNTSLK
jgi:maltose phosphorylase